MALNSKAQQTSLKLLRAMAANDLDSVIRAMAEDWREPVIVTQKRVIRILTALHSGEAELVYRKDVA